MEEMWRRRNGHRHSSRIESTVNVYPKRRQLELMKGIEEMDRQSVCETLKDIEEGTGRMMKIINHLKDFSRQTDFVQTSVQLHEVLESSLLMFKEQFRLKDIAIEKEYTQELPEILGNPNQLEQVFVNLISNARDALDVRKNAELTITAECRQIEDGNEAVIVKFRDNGSGIPSSVIDKIFDPFFSTKEVGKGAGLEMSIEPIDLYSVMLDATESVKPMAEFHNIDILRDEPHGPFFIKADCAGFRQVVLNLLSNEIKYNTPKERVCLSYEKKESEIRFIIADTGPGIAKIK